MARKKQPPEDILIEQKTEELTPEKVFEVLEFAKSYAQGLLYPNALSPQMLSQAMKNISFLPVELSETDLTNALKDPKNSEERLRQFMEHLEIVSMPLKRILLYMFSHLAYDLTYTATKKDGGELEESDYKSSSYKKDKALLYRFLDDFDWHLYFRQAVKQMLRNEVYFFAPRDDGNKIVLQELPRDRCIITGRWDFGFLISFDFSYLLQPGVDIRFYPKFFRDKFNELYSSKQKEYIPDLDPLKRGGISGKYSWWVDVPPESGWAFKFDTSIVTSIPLYTPLMSDLINQPTMRALQKDSDMAAASKMIIGQVPMRLDAKTSLRDAIAIDAETLGKFMALVQSALSTAIKVASAPLEEMKAMSFDSEPELYSNYLKRTIDAAGINSPMVYSGSLKNNTVETQLSFQSDSKVMEQNIYPQFQSFLTYWANRETKKHEFQIFLSGNDYYLDRDSRFDKAMKLSDKGMVFPMLFSSSLGMKPQTMERMMKQAKAEGFVEGLTPIVSSFNQSAETQGGRPRKGDSELSDKGEGTRGDGGNISKGGSV